MGAPAPPPPLPRRSSRRYLPRTYSYRPPRWWVPHPPPRCRTPLPAACTLTPALWSILRCSSPSHRSAAAPLLPTADVLSWSPDQTPGTPPYPATAPRCCNAGPPRTAAPSDPAIQLSSWDHCLKWEEIYILLFRLTIFISGAYIRLHTFYRESEMFSASAIKNKWWKWVFFLDFWTS